MLVRLHYERQHCHKWGNLGIIHKLYQLADWLVYCWSTSKMGNLGSLGMLLGRYQQGLERLLTKPRL